MERLTIKEGLFCDIAQCEAPLIEGPSCDGMCDSRRIYEKLRTLEDALADGRLVILEKNRDCDHGCRLAGDYGECSFTGYPPKPDRCADVIREAAEAALKAQEE